MNGLMNDVKPKFMVGLLAVLVGFFLISPAPVAEAQNYTIQFQADRTYIYRGECINIYWDTNNVQTVYYNNQPVSGILQSRIECPTYSTFYNLLVTTREGQQINRQIYVQVSDPPTGWNNWTNTMFIEFWVDRAQIRAGECVTVYWNTNNVQTVHYNDQPVSGIQQTRIECPNESAIYNLLVVTRTNQPILKQVYVEVLGSSFDEGDLDMRTGETVDFDEDGRVSTDEDDFQWIWNSGEEGLVTKIDDDDDLRLDVVEDEGSDSRFASLSQNECRAELDDDEDTVEVEEGTIVCLRTDDGDYGKFRVDDIRRSDGRLELDWYVWQ